MSLMSENLDACFLNVMAFFGRVGFLSMLKTALLDECCFTRANRKPSTLNPPELYLEALLT